MAGQVRFVVSAEVAQAINGFLRVVEAQKKIEHGFKGPKKESEELSNLTGMLKTHIEDAAKEALKLGAGFLSLEGAKEIIKQVVDELREARKELQHFHESAAGGETLPDYIKNLPAYKKRSFDLSTKYGADVNAVVNPLREKVYTEASDQSMEQREQMVETALEAHQFIGADPKAFAGVIDNMMDAYKNLSVKQASNAIMFLREKGGMDVADQSSTLADLLPTMKTMGVGFDQFEALMGMIPQAGGKNSSIGRGIREALFKFDELGDKGIITKGAGLEKNFEELAAIEKKDPAQFRELLGRRGAPAIDFLVNNKQMYQSLLKQAREANKGDLLGAVVRQVLQDPEEAAAIASGQSEQKAKNAKEMNVNPETIRGYNLISDVDSDWTARLPASIKFLSPAFTLMSGQKELRQAAAEQPAPDQFSDKYMAASAKEYINAAKNIGEAANNLKQATKEHHEASTALKNSAKRRDASHATDQ